MRVCTAPKSQLWANSARNTKGLYLYCNLAMATDNATECFQQDWKINTVQKALSHHVVLCYYYYYYTILYRGIIYGEGHTHTSWKKMVALCNLCDETLLFLSLVSPSVHAQSLCAVHTYLPVAGMHLFPLGGRLPTCLGTP